MKPKLKLSSGLCVKEERKREKSEMSGSVEVLAANNRSSGCDAGVVLPLTPRSPDRVEDYIEELTKNGPVELRAYGHQVGGHSLLMKFGKAVCKPMIPRERFFYDSRTLELQRFTPIYYGTVLARNAFDV